MASGSIVTTEIPIRVLPQMSSFFGGSRNARLLMAGPPHSPFQSKFQSKRSLAFPSIVLATVCLKMFSNPTAVVEITGQEWSFWNLR